MASRDPNPDVRLCPASDAAWWLSGRYRYRVRYGGRGGGKTFPATEALVYAMLKVRLRALCVRATQKSIQTSLRKELVRWMDWRGVRERFRVLETRIECPSTGSEVTFHGADTSTIEALRGHAAGVDITLIDEAHEIKPDVWDVLLPTLRPDRPDRRIELWVCMNTRWETDPVYRDFVLSRMGEADGDLLIKEVNWRDNPYFPEDLDLKRRFHKATLPRALYEHIWEGALKPGVERDGWHQLIDRRWIAAAMDADWWAERPRAAARRFMGNVALGHDVGEPDTLNNAVAVAHGPVVKHLARFGADSWAGVGDRVAALFGRHGAHHVFVDSTGVGQAAIGQYQGRLAHVPVLFGAPPRSKNARWSPGVTNGDHFDRRNAQLAWVARMRFECTWRRQQGEDIDLARCAWLDPSIGPADEVASDLAQPVWSLSAGGKVRIDKRGHDQGKSPDLFDALCLAWAGDSVRGLRASDWHQACAVDADAVSADLAA